MATADRPRPMGDASQRYVDRVRGGRRLDPLPDDDAARPVVAVEPDPDRARYQTLIRAALAFALSLLADRDRLRLGMYYAQQLTLAQAGRILGESEATVSRQLARTRKDLRRSIEEHLCREGRLAEAEIGQCFESVSEDAGPLDLAALLETAEPRKNAGQNRSRYEASSAIRRPSSGGRDEGQGTGDNGPRDL